MIRTVLRQQGKANTIHTHTHIERERERMIVLSSDSHGHEQVKNGNDFVVIYTPLGALLV